MTVEQPSRELSPEDFLAFDLQQAQENKVIRPPTETSSPEKSRFGWLWSLVKMAIGGMIIVLAVIAFYFLFINPLSKGVEESNARLANMQEAIKQLESDLRQAETRIPTPFPLATPTPLLPRWRFTGRIHKIDSQEPLPGLSVGLVIQPDRQNAPLETLDPVLLTIDGRFSINKNLSVGQNWIVHATVDGLSSPWQLQLSPGETIWQPESTPNVFMAVFERAEDVQPLELTAVIRRTFSGDVSIWTNDPNITTGLNDIPIAVEISKNDQDWQAVSLPEPHATNEEGRFEITVDSNIESAWYRLSFSLPDNYHMTLVETQSSDWIIGSDMIAKTIRAVSAGEFRDLHVQQQLLDIEMSPTQATVTPDLASWEVVQSDLFYKIMIANTHTNDVSATWEVALPAGEYELQVMTPPGVADATVRYTVEPAQGASMGHPNCPLYLSNQANRTEEWWDFRTVTGQDVLLTSIPQNNNKPVLVTVTAHADNQDNSNNGKTMALGPIRFVVTDEQRDFPDCARSH